MNEYGSGVQKIWCELGTVIIVLKEKSFITNRDEGSTNRGGKREQYDIRGPRKKRHADPEKNKRDDYPEKRHKESRGLRSLLRGKEGENCGDHTKKTKDVATKKDVGYLHKYENGDGYALTTRPQKKEGQIRLGQTYKTERADSKSGSKNNIS